MAREDRERPLSRGKEAHGARGLSRLGENPASHGMGQSLGCPPWGHWSCQGLRELTHLQRKKV